jgi:hypothetical protein
LLYVQGNVEQKGYLRKMLCFGHEKACAAMCCTIGLVRAKAKIGTKNLDYNMRRSVSCVASTRVRREKRSIKEANHATHHKKTTLKSVSHHQTRNEYPAADAFRHASGGITCFMGAKTVKNRGAFM